VGFCSQNDPVIKSGVEKSKAGVGGAVLDWQETRDPRRLEEDASQPAAFHS